MSKDNSQLTRVEQFLFGQLDDEACAEFLGSLKDDSKLRQELNEESSLEAALYSQQWLESSTSVRDDVAQWFSTDTEGTSLQKDDRLYSENKWNTIIENAWEKAQTPVKPAFIMPFSFRNIRAFSGLLLLVLIISGVVIFNRMNPPIADAPQNNTVAMQTTPENEQKDAVPSDTVLLEEVAGEEAISVFDTINEFDAHQVVKKSISLPPRKKGVVYLSKNSGFLAEKGADVTIISNTDSIVTLSMTRGSAVFTVEKNTYKRFAVITPFAEVRVVGTIFQVSVSRKKTDVKVVEGAVTITTIQGTQETLTLTKGKTVYVSEDSLVQDVIRKSRMLQQRENLLKSYLTYIHSSRPDKYPVEHLLEILRVRQEQAIDSLTTVFDPVLRAQLMHYRVAVNFENNHRYEKARDYLLRMYKEHQDNLFTQFALLHVCQLELHHFDRKKALGYMEQYIDEFPDGLAREEIMMLQIQTCLGEGDNDRAIPYMVQFIQDYSHLALADYFAFNLAQIFRKEKKELSNAMKYYEFITDNFPESSFHEDALYWAGWCLVQEQVHGKRNKYFRKYKKDYPKGNWTDVISNK